MNNNDVFKEGNIKKKYIVASQDVSLGFIFKPVP